MILSAPGATSVLVPVTLTVYPQPVLTVSKTHTGNFILGQTGAYTIWIGNSAGSGPTSGTLKVTEVLPPAGLTLVSMAGDGWSCGSGVCTRGESLAGGGVYSPITVIVNVAADAPAQVTNQVTAQGGGAATSASSSDQTSTVPSICAVTGDPVATVADVQQLINEALGIYQANHDLNRDGVVGVWDVQLAIDAALGLSCSL